MKLPQINHRKVPVFPSAETRATDQKNYAQPVSATWFKFKSAIFFLTKLIACLGILGSIYHGFLFYTTGESGYIVTILMYGTAFLVSICLIKNRVWRFSTTLTFFILFLFETSLRISNKYADYSERNSENLFENYHSASYGQNEMLRDGFWIQEPGATIRSRTAEYDYTAYYNGAGLRDSELSIFAKKPTIIWLGDSYTAGKGAPQDSTGIKAFESCMTKSGSSKRYSVVNAGADGSDLVHSYKLLTEKLYDSLLPKVVIYNLNCSDINDISFRGGDNRFTQGMRKASWWEFIYSFSYILRMVSNHFQLNPFVINEEDNAYSIQVIENKILDFKKFCEARDCKFILVITPIMKEVRGNFSCYYDMVGDLQDKVPIINTQQAIADTIKKNGSNYADYYYPLDCHFTPKGYWLWGQIVAKEFNSYENAYKN